eukprot:CAMPEP_0206275386 /NCGR_PEP_ID=MMETSP0047_2-20121206/35721_1 /ASSEMBLY_ACC=CAM_ASM_000192 /TAXON_ID=195065 /ORGANISM="Chroomonas mesostigmatica_cf, Strain CCMP1168" /LENGTH=118 /DNA_ID=CAMNT_0053704785 /DNA_START=30 /DNA_END=383 /DNA_ORIENTATION=-
MTQLDFAALEAGEAMLEKTLKMLYGCEVLTGVAERRTVYAAQALDVIMLWNKVFERALQALTVQSDDFVNPNLKQETLANRAKIHAKAVHELVLGKLQILNKAVVIMRDGNLSALAHP